jgi:DNA-binding MarR family transcriptional regulator
LLPTKQAETSASADVGLADAAPQYSDHVIWDRPGYLVRRLHQMHVALFMGQVAKGEVTPIQFGLLSILVNRPNIDQSMLGEELGLDPANIAEILKRLEARQLVSRKIDADNRRRKLCRATHEGELFVARYQKDMQHSQQQLLSPLEPGERDLFMDLLMRLVQGNDENRKSTLRKGTEILSSH